MIIVNYFNFHDKGDNHYKAEFLLILVALGWGLGFPVMKVAINQFPIFTVLWMRFLLAAFLLFPFCFKQLKQLNIHAIKAGVMLGILLFLSFFFLILGLDKTTASKTGFLASLFIIWIPLLSKYILKESIETGAKIGIVLAIIGTLFIFDWNINALNIGDMLVITGSLFTAFHIITLDIFSKKYSAKVLTFIQILVIAILSFFAALCVDNSPWPSTINRVLIYALLITSIFSTAFAFWVQTTFQKRTTPTKAALIYNLEPFFSVIFSVLILHEKLSTNTIIGGILIVFAMTISELWVPIKIKLSNKFC
jgi:drug/metabolite transporter (DMT)-like permease